MVNYKPNSQLYSFEQTSFDAFGVSEIRNLPECTPKSKSGGRTITKDMGFKPEGKPPDP